MVRIALAFSLLVGMFVAIPCFAAVSLRPGVVFEAEDHRAAKVPGGQYKYRYDQQARLGRRSGSCGDLESGSLRLVATPTQHTPPWRCRATDASSRPRNRRSGENSPRTSRGRLPSRR